MVRHPTGKLSWTPATRRLFAQTDTINAAGIDGIVLGEVAAEGAQTHSVTDGRRGGQRHVRQFVLWMHLPIGQQLRSRRDGGRLVPFWVHEPEAVNHQLYADGRREL